MEKESEIQDLFETPELIPDEVKAVFEKYDEIDFETYNGLEKILAEVELLGYTFEYYLDAVPYNLHKINLVV